MKAILILCLAVALGGCSSVDTTTKTDTGVKWWAPTTWPVFSGERKINQAAVAAARTDAAEAEHAAASAAIVRAAHIEFSKLVIALERALAADDLELARRFARNGILLLDQVDPLSAADVADLRRQVQDLRSADPEVSAAAESHQLKIEGTNAELSRRLQRAEAAAVAARAGERQANVAARVAALENVELANELRAWRWRAFWLCLAVLLLLALSLYIRMGLGSIGVVMPKLPKLIGAENAEKVVAALDAETDKVHQYLAGAARRRMEKAKAKLAKIVGDPIAT